MLGYKVAPLPGTFMLISMLGIFLSVIVIRSLSASYGLAFLVVFIVMFIASIMSTTYADVDEVLYMDKKAFQEDKEYNKGIHKKLKKMKSSALKKN
mgnify:CR=1 FL=1